jgi:manganese efflux pump family protein
MSPLEIIALAVALAMDAFTVAVAAGVVLRHVDRRQTFRLAFHFGLFQALMPVLGWAVGITVQSLIEAVDHWLAFGLLAFIGVRMLIEAVKGGGGTFNGNEPTRGMTMVMLSVATRIDALAVGLSLALVKISVWVPALAIGVITGAITAGGIHLGAFVGKRMKVARYAGAVGGIVLIGIGVRVLHEHGVF